jgi:hypothetical protein
MFNFWKKNPNLSFSALGGKYGIRKQTAHEIIKRLEAQAVEKSGK